jgi:hypothetical protein
MPFIFVCYRRSDAAGYAGRLYDELSDRFGEENVFKDLESIEPGVDFTQVIAETIARCDALVAVIGPRWLVSEHEGHPLTDPQDWVRREIGLALRQSVRVIPVLVEGARMPVAVDLPDEIKPLASRHAVNLGGARQDVRGFVDRLDRSSVATASAQPRREPEVDTPVLVPVEDAPFLMPVEDVFSITGRGTVATGRIEHGVVNTGDTVEIVGLKDTTSTVVTGVEMSRKILDHAEAGDNVGCLLRGIKLDEIERGQVLCTPGSITAHTKFEAEIHLRTIEKGGRHTPILTGYRPQFYFRTTDVTGVAKLPEGTATLVPGDSSHLEVDLEQPIAVDRGLTFAIREGGRTIGSGVVTRILL